MPTSLDGAAARLRMVRRVAFLAVLSLLSTMNAVTGASHDTMVSEGQTVLRAVETLSNGDPCLAIEQTRALPARANESALGEAGTLLLSGRTSDAMAAYAAIPWSNRINPAFEDHGQADMVLDGLNLISSGKLVDAKQRFARASGNGRDFGLATFMLAVVDLALGDKQHAVAHWLDVLKIGPLVLPGNPYYPDDLMLESIRMLQAYGPSVVCSH